MLTNKELILECNTAKYKLNESKFFLDLLKSEEIWNNDDIFSFYLNAFVLSSKSVVEYARSDFMHLIKNPRIDWKVYTRWTWKKNTKEISKHTQSKIIITFLKEFDEKLDEFRKDPLVNYFFNKRNTIIHSRWDGSKSSTFFIPSGGKKQYSKRCLENRLPLKLSKSIKDYKIGFFDEYISREDQLETLNRLCDESLIEVCLDYLSKLNNFINLFDKRNFFN